jgi:diguanylate cyclase (GGDEF)-like protein
MLDTKDQTTLPVRGRLHRPAGAGRLGNQAPSAAARREALAASLGLPATVFEAVPPSQAQRALERLTALTNRVRHLEEEAAVDELTGVLRRGAGLRLLQAEIDRVRRAGGRLVLAFVDLDGLKRVNDTHGHPAGDRMLQLVARTLRQRLRSYDLVIRYGGDEFLCVLSGAGVAQARAMVERVAAELRSLVGDHVLSFGFAELDADNPGDDAMALVGRADAALYRGRARTRRVAG